jgi:hypothetical protein
MWIRDPAGNLLNISDEGPLFPEQYALYRWRPKPPPDFGENKELG